MNRNSLLFGLTVFLTLTFWVSIKFFIGNKPLFLKQLELKQTELNEQYISAKILAEKLDQVYASENACVDPAVLNAQAISIPEEEW